MRASRVSRDVSHCSAVIRSSAPASAWTSAGVGTALSSASAAVTDDLVRPHGAALDGPRPAIQHFDEERIALRPAQPAQRPERRLGDVVLGIRRQPRQHRDIVDDRGRPGGVHPHLPGRVRGERQHADRGALAVALGQRHEGMRLPLPRPLRPRRARLRRQPAGDRLVFPADIAERIERRQDDVPALVVERIEQRLTAVQRDAPAGPRAHGFEPDHVGRVGERLANVADAVLIVDRGAGAGERQDREPAHLVVVSREHDRERLGIDALRRDERRHGVALLGRPAALEGARDDAQPRDRVLVERRDLAPQPRHRLERPGGADVRFVREPGKRPLEHLAEEGFGGLERLDLLVGKPAERASDGRECRRVGHRELQIAGGEQGVEHDALLLTMGHAVERRPAQRQAERGRGDTASRLGGEIRQEIGDDVAALEAAERLNRAPGEGSAQAPRARRRGRPGWRRGRPRSTG